MTTSHLRALAGATAAALLLLAGCSGSPDENGGGSLPEASGDFGDAPEFTWPDADPSGELEVEVLSEGDGPEVPEGAIVIANYEGHVWGSEEPFDSSYERGNPPVPARWRGAGMGRGNPGQPGRLATPHLDPPEKGYGSEGNPRRASAVKITIVFVVDVISASRSTASVRLTRSLLTCPAMCPSPSR